MQTPVLKDCKKEVMCSLSTRVYVSSITQTQFFLCLGSFFEWGFILISGFFLYLVGNGGIYSYGLDGNVCKHLC